MATDARAGLTEQQHLAVTARGVSVALSAGAGCGKTFVLTRRFLASLEPGAAGDVGVAEGSPPALSAVVAITFTERAAREMRDRIRKECRRRLREAPEHEADYWLGLIRQLDSARISTIHSFCGSLLRAHAVRVGIDPHFQILQQAQADTLASELIDDELRDRLMRRDDAVIELVVQFGLDRLRGMITELVKKRQEIHWAEWREAAPDDLVARWETFQREVTVPGVLARIEQSAPARAVLAAVRTSMPDHAEMRARSELLAERIPGLARSRDPLADLDAIHQSARVQGGGGKKAWPDEAAYAAFRDAAAGLRKLIDDARPTVLFDPGAARAAAEASLQLLEVSRSVVEAYEARKREVPALDFNDLLIRARGLLTSPENEDLRRRLSSQTTLLLVDEFQDTDPLQVELVEALTGGPGRLTGGKLFFVGDFKQSIYRFRGADPHVFQRLRGMIPAEGRLPLTMNFRSQPAVLRFVNALFCDDLGPEYEPLEPSRPQVTAEPAVEFLWAPDPSPGERTGQSARLRKLEADWIARRLKWLLESGEPIVWDKTAADEGRPAARAVKAGEIAILFRALSDVQHYEEALRRHGIDYYLVGGHAFYAQQEIFDLLNLLRALASPCDDVSVAGVLRSPMFNLEDETLFWLARHPDGLRGGLTDTPPAALRPDQRDRVRVAANVLAGLQSIKDRVPVAELIQQALERTGYDAVVLAEFLGERKLANLRKLIDQARSFDASGIFSLSDFITQLSEFVARQPDEPLAATNPESTDVVKLMTIHQSKGLEFPVVVIPDLERGMVASRASVAFMPRLGPMVKHPAGPGGFELHATVEKAEEQAELVRLLYVATTRAADYLMLSSGVPALGSCRGPWTELLFRRFDLLTGALKAALPDGYLSPNVKITTEEPPIAGKASPSARGRDLSKLVTKAVEMAGKGAGRTAPHLGAIPPDRAARRQYSFSRLTGELHEPVPAIEEDDSVGGPARLDPLGLGTLVHAVLAELDFREPEDVEALVRRLAPRHLAESHDNLDEPIDLIRRFLASPRAAQIAAASTVYPELEFLLAWPPESNGRRGASVSAGRESFNAGPIYLQGFIDCLYQDNQGAWHVVDYKTNRVTPASVPAVAAPYEMQMLVYGLAVERIFGRPPESLILCFLRPGTEHRFAWDAAARDRVVGLVNGSIEKRTGEGGGTAGRGNSQKR